MKVINSIRAFWNRQDHWDKAWLTFTAGFVASLIGLLIINDLGAFLMILLAALLYAGFIYALAKFYQWNANRRGV